MKRHQRFIHAGVLVVGLGQAFSALASDSSSCQGQVQDALGQPVGKIRVELTTSHDRVLEQTTTDASGHFQFNDLKPNTYRIRISAPGYEKSMNSIHLRTKSEPIIIHLASLGSLQLVMHVQRHQKPHHTVALSTGTSEYHMDAKDIARLPQGSDSGLNQVLLQTPGVVQDSYGQVHIRGEHGNLQYRLNGIVLPESIEGFGQTLDPQDIQGVSLLTGSLPAAYGYRTAGVVDIRTRSGAFANSGSLGMEVGTYATRKLDASKSGHQGSFNYFVSGSLESNNIGIENPTPSTSPVHDHTVQEKVFGYFSWLLNDHQKLTAIVGSSDGHFQIPNVPGQLPQYNIAGQNNIPASSQLNDQQSEHTHYGVLSLSGSTDQHIDYQVGYFSRYSQVQFTPNTLGELAYLGQSTQILRSGWENGLQADFTKRFTQHTVRWGSYLSTEHLIDQDNVMAFSQNSGQPVSTTPIALPAINSSKQAYLEGVYLQDEWQATQRLTVNYGVRADHVAAYVEGSQLSPRLNSVYQLSAETTIHAGYSRYFTPPPYELVPGSTILSAQNTTAASAVTMNSSVKPERSNAWDLGLDHQWSSALSTGIDSYYKQVTDLLDEGQFGQSLLYTPFNYAYGKIYGIELTSNYHLSNFSAYLNLARSGAYGKDIISSQYTFSQPELNFIQSQWIHLDHDQTLTASGGMSYLWRDTTYAADFIAGSGLRNGFANTQHLPGYTNLNLSADRMLHLPWIGNLDSRIAIVNVLDRIYEIRDGTGVGVGAPQFGQRRGFYLSMQKKF